MNGQNGWYPGQPPQYPFYQEQPRQQQISYQHYQQPSTDQQYFQNEPTFFHGVPASNLAQSQYVGVTNMDQSLHGRSAGSSLAATSFPVQMASSYAHSHHQHHSPSAGLSANVPRRESVSSRTLNHILQPTDAGQQAQNSSYIQPQQPQHQYDRMTVPSTRQPSDPSWQGANMASPVQHRSQATTGPFHPQQHAFAEPLAFPSSHSTPRHQLQPPRVTDQYGMESPYAPSTGTRDRLAMSQSPMSDAFQSGGPSSGRTFNLMAGLGTPTPAPPQRRVSAQDSLDNLTHYEGKSHAKSHDFSVNATLNPQPTNLSRSGQCESIPSGSAQQIPPWPSAQQGVGMQGTEPSPNLAVWNQTKAKTSMETRPIQSNAALQAQYTSSIDSGSPTRPSATMRMTGHQSSLQPFYSASPTAVPAHGGSGATSVQSGAYPAPPSTGSSLDAAWGVPPSHSSFSARPPSATSIAAHSHHMPQMTEPGSPSLSVARFQSLASRSNAQPSLQSLSSFSTASTLDTAMSASPNIASLKPNPHLTEKSVTTAADSKFPVDRSRSRPAKRPSKAKLSSEAQSHVQNALSRPTIPSPANSMPGSISQSGVGALPRFTSSNQPFAMPPLPTPSPAHSVDPLAMRQPEEPQTPPQPTAPMLSVQESPDPLNFLSPNGHFSLWQHPSLPPQPFPGNGALHHQLPPQQHDISMVQARDTPVASSSSTYKDSAPTDKPKRKRSKKAKGEPVPQTPTFSLKVDDSAIALAQAEVSQDSKPIKLKKSRKKEAFHVKDESDAAIALQLTVDIPLLASDPDEASHSSHARSPFTDYPLSESKDVRKKKRKRSRKSFSDLMNQIVEDSDSGMDAEGSDWDDLDILETWDVPAPNETEPTSEASKGPIKMSNGPVKSSQRKVPLAKLRGLIEDLFEADDSLPDRDTLQELLPGQNISSTADQFFEIIELPSSSGGDSRSILVLRAAALQKLLKLILLCSRHNLGVANMSAMSKPATIPSLSTIPAADVTRLLTILERTVRVEEDLDPFPSHANRAAASEPTSPTKPKKGRKAGRQGQSPSKTPEPARTPDRHDGGEAEEKAGAPGNEEEIADSIAHGDRQVGDTNEELDRLNATFAVMDRSVLATECSLGFLTGDVLPKQVLSEDHIRSCFEAVKTCLDKVVLPFIEACSGSTPTAPHPVLVSLIDALAPQKARKKKATTAPGEEATSSIGVICRNTLSDLFSHLCSALLLVQRMVRMPSIALSESIVISAVYLALGPFFVLEPEATSGGATSEHARAAARGRAALLSLGGSNTMKTLRTPALNLLRSIFAKAPDQRQWMIEEILTSLTKLTDMKKNRRQFSLRNGKGIHSINALLLQLIQAASHGVAAYARSTAERLSRSRDGQDGDGDSNNNGIEMLDGEADSERAQRLEVVIDAYNNTAGSDKLDAREAEIAVWKRGLEGANQSARSIASYLMQRIGQTKIAKSSQEMSHAYVIESLIQDLLSALFLPEWPAAALMLSAFCRVFGNYLEDPKSHPDAKGVALEQLSLVATRVRQSQLQLQPIRAEQPHIASEQHESHHENGHGGNAVTEPLSPSKRPRWTTWEYLSMLRALREGDRSAIQEFVRAYKFLFRFLAKASSEDLSTEGALEFLLVQAEGELATAWAKADEDKQVLDSSEGDSLVQKAKLQHFREEIDAAMLTLSELDPAIAHSSITAFTSDDQMLDKAIDLSERALIASSSMISFEALRNLLLEGLNNPLIANRSKALRGIDRIAQVDPDLLDEDAMRSAIEVRLRDSSNAVRDNAVALFGNYLLRKPQHIPKYYKQLAARVLDTGLAVRKRMVRLLKSFFEAADDQKIRIDACARLVRCINDEDALVQDMAVLTIGEMWLDMDIDARRLYLRRKGTPPQVTSLSAQSTEAGEATEAGADTRQEPVDATSGDSGHPLDEGPLEETETDRKVAETIEIIMAVADVVKERPSPLEEVFRRLFKDKTETEAAELHSKLQKLGDSMINSLVESSGASTVDTVKRIRIVQLLVSTNPAILAISKAKLLLPYLKGAQTSEEVQIMDLLLRIFRSCLPHMPKTALAFAESLEKSLRPLVNRPPPKAGLHLLQELIACYCAVITTHTHNFRLLVQTLKACLGRVQAMRQMALKGQKVEDNKAWSTLMSLTASLCEHANFDEIRAKHPAIAPEIDALSKRPLVDVVSEALLDIHRTGSETVRSVSLQNLGFIFRAHPTLMTRPSMTAMMDGIFASGSLQDRATLLKIMLDFLSADSLRRNPDNTVVNVGVGRRKPENPGAGSVDMTILVGNTETFADTGVGSAMMQRYSEDVLKATLEVSNPTLQRTAIDILRFTVLQGLSHPIQCVPYLVSLETLEDRKIRSRAMELHSHLASKHASLVHARFLDTARSAFRFQLQRTTTESMRGYHVDSMPTAVLGAWYSLLRDRRAVRLDFLKQIVKALDVNTAASECSIQEVLFARFMADNLATLDYKTMEELFVVIGELRSILAVSGTQVLYMVHPYVPKPDALAGPAVTPPPQDGLKTPPAGVAVPGGELVSPFQLSRNPWLSGQPQLAGEAPIAFPGTIVPTQIFSWPQPSANINGDAPSTNTVASNHPFEAREHEEEEDRAKMQVDPITVARMSVISGTALLLRNHLKQLYGLSEARCAKFNPAKKQSAGADKPATMRVLSDPMQAALDFTSMPFGLQEIKNEQDAKQQMLTYATMVDSEGTMLEPDDPDVLDELAL